MGGGTANDAATASVSSGMTAPAPKRIVTTDSRLEQLRRLARLLDDGLRIPGTQIGIGLDPIIGLIPGAGDAAGAIMGAAILMEAARRGVPRATLVRIVGNVVLDAALGSVPVAGDLFDLFWKANRRNMALLERHAADPASARRDDRTLVWVLGGAALVVVAAVVLGGAWLSVKVLRTLLA